MHYRHLIQNFSQKVGESIDEAWERLNELTEACPHHGIPPWMLVQNFYSGPDFPSQQLLDSSAGGAFTCKGIDVASKIIENVVSNHPQWENERRHHPIRDFGAQYSGNQMEKVISALENLSQRFGKL